MLRKKNQSKVSSNVRHLITKVNPKSPISEQYRTVRTNMQFSSVDNNLKSFLVTSSGPAEGKSSTTANLAIVYAQQGKRVLLIDADLRKPTMHYTFRLDNLRGLSNVLVGEISLEEAVNGTDIDTLDVMTCGPIPPNPSQKNQAGSPKTIVISSPLTPCPSAMDRPITRTTLKANNIKVAINSRLHCLKRGSSSQSA